MKEAKLNERRKKWLRVSGCLVVGVMMLLGAKPVDVAARLAGSGGGIFCVK